MIDTVFNLDPEIIIGTNTANRAGTVFKRAGSKVLIATEQGLYDHNHIERLTKVLEDAGLETILFDEIPAQATADAAEIAASLARAARCDMIVGLGSQRTQHLARLISILAASDLRLFDLLDGKIEKNAFLPMAAMPTGGGDPFLFSDNIVVVDPRDGFAKLLLCPRRLCQAVILDPGLSEPLTDKITSTASFDGLCASLEAYCSAKANFLSDALLEQAIFLFAGMILSYTENRTKDLPVVFFNACLLMSLGASISAPGIGSALAYAVSGKFPVAKSWCSTVLLPYIMEKLVAVKPEKMAKAAAIMGETTDNFSTAEAANMAVDAVRRRMGQLSVPGRLKDFNLSLDRLVPVAEAARNLEFAAFSPWTVTSDDAFDLLKQAY